MLVVHAGDSDNTQPGTVIEVIQGDITRLEVDAIVNAANESLLGGGGVDGAIHRAAGPELREYNAGLGGCPTGEARISPGFRLSARYVISTVGPVWRGGHRGEPALLEACYRNALELALDNGVRTIAFPGISTGVFGYPKEQAAAVAIRVMREYEERFRRLIACTHSDEDTAIYESLLNS